MRLDLVGGLVSVSTVAAKQLDSFPSNLYRTKI